jgi:signal transduction histidine kinase
MSLRRELLLLLALFALLPLAVVTVVGHLRLSGIHRETRDRDLALVAANNGASIDAWVEGVLQQTRMKGRIVTLSQFLEGRAEVTEAVARGLIQVLGADEPVYLVSASLHDLGGRNRLDTRGPGESEAWDSAGFAEVLATGLPVLVTGDAADRGPQVSVMAPIRNTESQIVGVYRSVYDALRLRTFLTGGALSVAGVHSVLMDAQGRIIARSDGLDPVLDRIDPRSAPVGTVARGRWTAASRLPGADMDRLVLKPLEKAPWFLGVVEEAGARAKVEREGVAVAAMQVLLAGGALVVAAWLMARRITRPLSALSAAASRISKGELDTPCSPESGGELGRLGEAFETMRANLVAERVRARDHADAERRSGQAIRRSESELARARDTLEERVRERTRELEISNRELESFSYAVAHDLRTPLRAISGYAKVLEDDLGPRLTGTEREALSRISESIRRMGELMDATLKLTRVARVTLQPGPVDLTALFQQAAADLQGADRARRMSVEVEAGLGVLGDRGLLQVLVSSLMENAWKYTSGRDPGRIQVRRRLIEGQEVFEVADNGIGFDMAYAGKLFEPFRRLQPDAEARGQGIGLAMARRIVQRHGGRIWANAAPDRGATFHFTLKAKVSDGSV